MAAERVVTLLAELQTPSIDLHHVLATYEQHKKEREQAELREHTYVQRKQQALAQLEASTAPHLLAELSPLCTLVWSKRLQDKQLELRHQILAEPLHQFGIPIVPLTAAEVRQQYGDWLQLHRAAVLTLSELLPDASPVKFSNQVVQDKDMLLYFSVASAATSSTYFACHLKRYSRWTLGKGGQGRAIVSILAKEELGHPQKMLQQVATLSGYSLPSLLLGTSYVFSQEALRLTTPC